jgi:hypothetical protein
MLKLRRMGWCVSLLADMRCLPACMCQGTEKCMPDLELLVRSAWPKQADMHCLPACMCQGTEKYVPDLELHVLEDCSHWVQQDQPGRVHALMRDFIARTSQGDSKAPGPALAATASAA